MFTDDTTVEVEESTEETTDTEETTEETETEETKDWKAEALKYKAILDRNKTKGDKAPAKSNEFGYDVKAYLKASGINSTEFDFVKQEMKQAGVKDVDTLLGNKYFQSRLEEHRELARTQEAIPTGKRTGGVATDSIDYWLSKPIEEVPADKRRAVVNARLEREQNKGKFYNG